MKVELCDRDYEVINMVRNGDAHLRRRYHEVTAYERVPESPTGVHAIRTWSYDYADKVVELCETKVYLSNAVR